MLALTALTSTRADQLVLAATVAGTSTPRRAWRMRCTRAGVTSGSRNAISSALDTSEGSLSLPLCKNLRMSTTSFVGIACLRLLCTGTAQLSICEISAEPALTCATSHLSSKGKREGVASIDSHDFLTGAYFTPPAQSAPLKASIHCACSLLLCFWCINMCA